jgi:hypothetical protein
MATESVGRTPLTPKIRKLTAPQLTGQVKTLNRPKSKIRARSQFAGSCTNLADTG